MAIRNYFKDGKLSYEVYVQGVEPLGKRVQFRKRGLTSKRQAEALEFEFKRKLADEKDKTPSWTWANWHEHCCNKLKLILSHATMMDYEGRITKWVNPHWGDRHLESFTPQDVHDLLHQKILGLSQRSKREVLKLIKRMFSMAMDQGLIIRNPASGMKVKVVEVKQAVLNGSEIEKLLREAKACEHRFYPVWAVALLTGMRSGELYALKWVDVDFESAKIFVTRSWSNKNGFGSTKSATNRVVPISKALEKLLKELKLKAQPDDEFVLPRLRQWRLGEQAQVTRDFCKAIKITPIKFHDLRATFITQLLLKGAPLAKVMAVVGHNQLKTTTVYLRVVGADLGGVTETLGIELPSDKEGFVIPLKRGE